MSQVPDPTKPGSYTFQQVIYAAPGLDYAQNFKLEAFTRYAAPAPGYETRRVDLSAFAVFPYIPRWPFGAEAAPVNGQMWLPEGPGPFPVFVIAHGNHDPVVDSAPGYAYLCEHLASHGILALSIDASFLNGSIRGENDARAILQLEHLRQLATWNARPDHPLHGRVDLERVVVAGHSRGGEAAAHASVFNTLRRLRPDSWSPPLPLDGTAGLGPYGFGIRGVLALAPTDGQYQLPEGPTVVNTHYLLLHGSRDNDVFSFDGQLTYDRARPAPGAFEALLWIHGACHNYFNATWNLEAGSAEVLPRGHQERITVAWTTAYCRLLLGGEAAFRALFEDHRLARRQGWLPAGPPLVSQYRPAGAVVLQDFEGERPALVPPVRGEVEYTAYIRLMPFDQGRFGHLYQETRGLRVEWQEPGPTYTLYLEPGSYGTAGCACFAFRVGQSAEPLNEPGETQDLRLSFSDGHRTCTFEASDFAPLVYPDTGHPRRPMGVNPRTVMQGIRVPLAALADRGVAPGDLRVVRLQFDRRIRGVLYLDDLRFSE